MGFLNVAVKKAGISTIKEKKITIMFSFVYKKSVPFAITVTKGQGEIRTLDLTGETSVFKTGALDRSAT